MHLNFYKFPYHFDHPMASKQERTWNVANMHFHKELNFTRNLKEIKVQLHQFMQRLFKMQHYQSTDQNAALSVHRSKYSIISPKIKMQHYQLLNTSMQQYPSKDLR